MDYDFIVVGAGIAGASIAYELAVSGRVCLIEGEERPGMHTTGRSAALFAPSYGGREIRAITRASQSFFDAPPPGFCDRPLLVDRGCMYVARADQLESLDAMIDAVRSSGGSLARMTTADALAQIPLLRGDYVAAAALDTDARDIDVDALHQGFLRGAKARGAALVTERWIRHAAYDAGRWAMDLGDRIIHAPILVNAAGAWGDQVAEACGIAPIGIQPLRRTALLVDPPATSEIRDWPAVIDADEMFYFKPDAGKLLLSPADETPDQPGDAQPEELDIAIAVDRVQAALDIEVRRVTHSWAGLRNFAPDRVPVIGFDADHSGFFWCVGQGGYGIQTAPALSRLSAALARGEALPTDIADEGLAVDDISPRRFQPARSA